MQNQTHVDRASCSMRQEGFEAKQSIEPDRPRNTWKFVGDFQQLMGEDAEPDSLFFVESWTLGAPAAMTNLQKRLLAQVYSLHNGQEIGESISLDAPSFVTEKAPYVEYVSSSRTRTELNTCGAEQWQDFLERPEVQIQSHTAQDARILPEWDGYAQESIDPITPESACQLLGVTLASTRKQIKSAYRQTVSEWHPDRFENETREVRQVATQKMVAINEAYRLLIIGRT
jgi:hypothetical protein